MFLLNKGRQDEKLIKCYVWLLALVVVVQI